MGLALLETPFDRDYLGLDPAHDFLQELSILRSVEVGMCFEYTPQSLLSHASTAQATADKIADIL